MSTTLGRAFRLVVLCSALLPVIVSAQPRADPDEEDDKKAWSELEVKLPPYPKPANLLRFEVSAASDNHFYIDPDSLAVGDDGIVRYTLVIRSPGGPENVSYEGIRCETREQKSYAFGRRDGTWVNARVSEWRGIEYKDINRQHGVLYLDFFCPDKKRPVGSSKDIINRFKYGAPPRGGA